MEKRATTRQIAHKQVTSHQRNASNAVETILLKNAKNPMFVECVVKKATCPRSVQGLRLIPLQRKMARK